MASEMIKVSTRIAIFFCFLSCTSSLPARTKAHSPARQPAAVASSYVAALAVGNRLMYAWQTQDEEKGLVLLTDAAKEHATEDGIEIFFTAATGAQRTYEIGRGKLLKPGRYLFPVMLFETQAASKSTRPEPAQIVVVQTGEDEWAVDKLP